MKQKLLALTAAAALAFSFTAVQPAVVVGAGYSCKTAYPTYNYANPTNQFTIQLKVVGCYDPGYEVWGQSISVIYYHYVGLVYPSWNPTGDTKGWTSGVPVVFYLNDPHSLYPRINMSISGNFSACYDNVIGGSGHSSGTYPLFHCSW